jgi:hypothetical protein
MTIMSEIKAYRTLVLAFRNGLDKTEQASLRKAALEKLEPICCGARADKYTDGDGC